MKKKSMICALKKFARPAKKLTGLRKPPQHEITAAATRRQSESCSKNSNNNNNKNNDGDDHDDDDDDEVVLLKMTAASMYIPKDDDRDYPPGDDAHFISADHAVVAVADGIGSWRNKGIDGGEYARQLMNNSVTAMHKQLQRNGVVKPKRVLLEAYICTTVKGSSTACIVALSGDKLVAANVGDSGFLVIRNGAVLYKSPIQQHRFNAPYQLGTAKDHPSVAEEIEVRVEWGDVVVVGTDGLFDNMHPDEILEVVRQCTMQGKSVEEMCYYVAYAALYNSLDENKASPFSIAASAAGESYRGGKVHDITVVIARIS